MTTIKITTLRQALLTLADRAATALQPPARGEATATTLRQMAATRIAGWIGHEGLHSVLAELAVPRQDDTDAIAARRRTCGDLAELAATLPDPIIVDDRLCQGDTMSQCAFMWRGVGRELLAAAPDDHRIAAIAATLEREGNELQLRSELDRIAEMGE